MVIAIPVFNGAVAPCFEAARVFLLATVRDGHLARQEMVEAQGCEGFGQVQLLRDRSVAALICNGIKAFYRDILNAAGITVIPGIAGPADLAVGDFCAGRIVPSRDRTAAVDLTGGYPLEDLICWSKELFSAHGFRVRSGADAALFPIDLVAEIECPVCRRPVRVAICCGAHAYRPEQEIQALHLAAAADYHASVYVHTSSTTIKNYCEQYGIELIDPDAGFARHDRPEADRIPILQRPISGHEQASLAGADGETS